MAERDFGKVWQGEAVGISRIRGISLSGIDSVSDINAIAYGIRGDTAEQAVISQGRFFYDNASQSYYCDCPFGYCDKWILFVWRRNENLAYRDLSWEAGKSIPVSQMISELKLYRQRLKDHTTNIARAIKFPEEGSNGVFIPVKPVRAGKLLGFDDEGKLVVGNECPQIAELNQQQANMEELLTQAQIEVGKAEGHVQSAKKYADEASGHVDTAESWAKQAQTHEMNAKLVLTDINNKASEFETNINIFFTDQRQILEDKVDSAVEAAEIARDDAQAAAEEALKAVAATGGSVAWIEDALCYIGCATERAETAATVAKGFVDGRALYDFVLSECEASSERVLTNAHDDNMNLTAYIGTFKNIGAEGDKIAPKTISLYRRKANSAVDSSVGRYLRVLRKNASGAWYIAYKSSNALAPNTFPNIGDEMKWQMTYVEGSVYIPADEEIAIVQADRENATAAEFVFFGARSTTAYGGASTSKDLTEENLEVLETAPAISMEYLASVPLSTVEDVTMHVDAAKTELSGLVAAEATAREAADNALGERIDSKVGLFDEGYANPWITFGVATDGAAVLRFNGPNPDASYRFPYTSAEPTVATLDDIPDITALETALAGKAASSHTHAIANVSGLQSALDGKASTTTNVLGYGATVKDAYCVALGRSASASGNESTALGSYASAEGYCTTALGNSASASGNYSTALGYSASASGYCSTALGYNAKCLGMYSTALGLNAESAMGETAISAVSTGGERAQFRFGFTDGDGELYFIFEDKRSGVKITKTNFFAMLKAAGGEDWTA